MLVVEDNAVNLELLVALLEQEGCEVLVAETADAGLHLARTAQPALILMDVQLPGMTGYEATRHLKADPATAAIPIVALTALAMRGEEERAKAAGCAGYLTKPLDTETFRETVRQLLGSGGSG
ncbi:MAG: response regulator [candidate division NC10 bacterium]|nr:response regulator [candidate division NC10 bacterium]